MNAVFPESPGLSGTFLQAARRRPGSGVSADNIEAVYAVIVKQAFTISPSDDPALGSLAAREDGPVIFEADFPENMLVNAAFEEGDANWADTGGATATFGEAQVELVTTGGGDLRQTTSFGRQLRDRTIAISAKAVAQEGFNAPQFSIVASSQTVTETDAAVFADKPLVLADAGRASATVTSSTLSARFEALDQNNEVLTLSELGVITTEYESDLVPYKQEADIIVIADAPPLPISVAVNGTVRFSQETSIPQELTGLGWADRSVAPRLTEAGDVEAVAPPEPTMPQALPNDFDNRFYNGYRRDRRVGGTVAYLEPGDEITLTRDAGVDYAFTLPEAIPELRHKWFTGGGKDDPCLWRSRAVPLHLDTLVIEPDRDHAYAVWRACWPIDDPLGGLGPIAADANREATVTLEGAF